MSDAVRQPPRKVAGAPADPIPTPPVRQHEPHTAPPTSTVPTSFATDATWPTAVAPGQPALAATLQPGDPPRRQPIAHVTGSSTRWRQPRSTSPPAACSVRQARAAYPSRGRDAPMRPPDLPYNRRAFEEQAPVTRPGTAYAEAFPRGQRGPDDFAYQATVFMNDHGDRLDRYHPDHAEDLAEVILRPTTRRTGDAGSAAGPGQSVPYHSMPQTMPPGARSLPAEPSLPARRTQAVQPSARTWAPASPGAAANSSTREWIVMNEADVATQLRRRTMVGVGGTGALQQPRGRSAVTKPRAQKRGGRGGQ